MSVEEKAPVLVVVSGPSAVGKTAIIDAILERDPRFTRPITMTTRAPRDGEVDGLHYLFVTPDRFRAHLHAGELLEHATIHGNEYGAPRSTLREALASGRDVIMQVDVQGSEALRELLPDALYVFVVPDDLEKLRRRLVERALPEQEVAVRMATTLEELRARERFTHVIENVDGDLEGSVEAVLELINSERARPGRRALAV